jgi:hypothetical protein
MLASDLNNPDFTGPRNPDEMLSVEFYWHEPIDRWASEEAGKIIKRPKQPFVRIMIPGRQESILEVAVNESHKMRWPQKWLYWQMKENLVDGEAAASGWSIEEWDELDEELRRNLRHLRFQTVEQLAGANDHQVSQMGMGGLGLRAKARKALAVHNNQQMQEELEKRDSTIASLTELAQAQNAALADLQKAVAELQSKPKQETITLRK